MLSAHYGFTGKFSAWRNTGGPRDWFTPGHRAARMGSLLTSRRRVRVSHGASHTSASVMVDVKICYDRSTAWAGQAFHDLNVFSIRPNASTAVSMDMRDPLTHVTRTIADMPFFSGRIKSDRQLSKKSNGIATLSVLARVFCGGNRRRTVWQQIGPCPREATPGNSSKCGRILQRSSEQIWASDGGSPQHSDRDARGLGRSWRSGSPID